MMCLFKNKKIRDLKDENSKLNDSILNLKKQLLKITSEKSDLLESCINIITESISEPELRSSCLLKLGKYKNKEETQDSKKIVYFITVFDSDKTLFLQNYKDLANDFNLKIEASFILSSGYYHKYKVIINYSKAESVQQFWSAIKKVLKNSFDKESI